MTNAFDIKNPIVKIDTKAMDRAALNSRLQSGVVNKKRKEGVELSLMGGSKLNPEALEPRAIYYFSKAVVK